MTEVKLFDQKSSALVQSTTTTTQGTMDEFSKFGHEEINHPLVRRYTEDLDNERLLLELERAQSKFY